MGVLQGKIAVITGRNSGIGLAAAKRFVSERRRQCFSNNNFPARLIPRREQFPFLNAGEKDATNCAADHHAEA